MTSREGDKVDGLSGGVGWVGAPKSEYILCWF